VPCGTRVSYGLDSKSLTQRIEGAVTANHEVQIKDLKAGTTYHFTVGSARVQLGTGIFTTTGQAAPPLKPVPASKAEVPLPKPGNTVVEPTPPPTKQIWGNVDSLQDHFNRHGADFKAQSPADYAAKAWLFLQRARREGLPMKWDDTDRTLRAWDPKTRSFAAYDRYGRARTYFKPSNPNYWNQQPGRTLKPEELRF